MNINDIQRFSIFTRIAELVKDRIMLGEYQVNERIPSVRELASEMQVNPNTVVRAFDRLVLAGIIYPKRGMGFFVSEQAAERIAADRRKAFEEEVLPAIFGEMEQLGVSMEEVLEIFRIYKNSKH
ncbi:GntR family transcriptional regulator [Porphyromonas crevioricanis]|uniref:GntR family transcriptional regulator n=2 Tax=Porphyromonas crevioricanis TaxID=393921 RepID=A0A0A2G184_9PORP|nr:GntR family transcriptional regulator [Porphyromonas crevioricanis]KGN90233.1 GntR family transcriptional regulator [Porphyromonas crevioricanis]KGN96120.1 GntR family transcriptional regulator [Porphyromonas crevioricanis]SKA03244.1 transcriptional regulator, GntR family [Porphyromonas crevioricanis]SQH72635.1 HTH-type transcriptional repressor yvoA [Porphyromonas crevioricanis]GAD05906.1 transcriptional regulator, GntR family [Porphyromonas crevioricanis JCM 15906]